VRPRYPTPPDGYTPISTSAVMTFLRCGYRYWMEKEKGNPVTARMARGTALSRAAETDNRAKMAGEEKHPDELIEVARSSFSSELPAMQDKGTTILKTKASLPQAVLAWVRDLSPGIGGVTLAEKPLVGLFHEERIVLCGTPDFFANNCVRDVKTGRRWRPDDVHTSVQLTTYSWLHLLHVGTMPTAVAVDSIHRDRHGRWIGETLWSSRTPEDLQSLWETVKSVVRGIQKGVALPADPTSWHCSAAWCPLFWECPHVGDARKRAAKDREK